jgi:hypothetical protein
MQTMAAASISSTAPAATHSEFAIQYETSPRADPDDRHETKLSAVTDNASANASGELAQLKKKMSELSKENAVLRHELSIARSKLDQIKKIA